jgi:hypothetical protein
MKKKTKFCPLKCNGGMRKKCNEFKQHQGNKGRTSDQCQPSNLAKFICDVNTNVGLKLNKLSGTKRMTVKLIAIIKRMTDIHHDFQDCHHQKDDG